MKCEDVSKELIAYLDGRTNAAERAKVEGHLAGCAACRTRAEEMRRVSMLLGELPAIEPSFAFDARVRQRVAAEPQRSWFWRLIPPPRPAFAVALLIALTVLVAKLPSNRPLATPHAATSAQEQEEDFNAIKNLGVLENYDVLTKFDALAETPATPSAQPDGKAQQSDESND
ncbi:MAG TPA: zf-HC2 domain-containing protein [Candidatus Acidoferrales bacterium]|jgi:anti-sigma factor RsiW|nr:zf-HC2 domain-containing protein [Candidatus Acidoferrales bacterium]